MINDIYQYLCGDATTEVIDKNGKVNSSKKSPKKSDIIIDIFTPCSICELNACNVIYLPCFHSICVPCDNIYKTTIGEKVCYNCGTTIKERRHLAGI